jgi:hypothetical protein
MPKLGLLLWFSWGAGRPAGAGGKAPNPITMTVGWGYSDLVGAGGKAPKKERPTMPPPSEATETTHDYEYLVNRLGIIADATASYRETANLHIPAESKVNALYAGLKQTGADLRALIVDVTGRDPWAHHPPGAAP